MIKHGYLCVRLRIKLQIVLIKREAYKSLPLVGAVDEVFPLPPFVLQ